MNAVCIRCWNPDAVVKMHLDGSRVFECAECGETFDADEVNTCLDGMRKGWEKLIKWAEAYPTDDAE